VVIKMNKYILILTILLTTAGTATAQQIEKSETVAEQQPNTYPYLYVGEWQSEKEKPVFIITARYINPWGSLNADRKSDGIDSSTAAWKGWINQKEDEIRVILLEKIRIWNSNITPGEYEERLMQGLIPHDLFEVPYSRLAGPAVQRCETVTR
jgi:hypothetical protein